MATALRDPDALIVTTPGVLGGAPCLAGTRIPAEAILACLVGGDSDADIRAGYPGLPADGIAAVRRWATASGRL